MRMLKRAGRDRGIRTSGSRDDARERADGRLAETSATAGAAVGPPRRGRKLLPIEIVDVT